MKDVKKRANSLAKILNAKKNLIASILIQCETMMMFEDEFIRCIDLLSNLEKQQKYLSHQYNKVMASFLPLNQPLYSFVLQVFIPSLIMKQVYYRPPASQQKLHIALLQELLEACENIEICPVSRKKFVSDYIKNCAIVNFTGRYENAMSLINELPKNIAVVYNGSAVNPIVIGDDANIELAVKDTVCARLYNSGQDCMAPACILLDSRISSAFLAMLKYELEKVVVGSNEDSTTNVGSLIETNSIERFINLSEKYRRNIVFGGHYDTMNKYIFPTIFFFEHIMLDNLEVYYAPYFWIMSYKSIDEVQILLDSEYCEHYAGYISLYGKSVQKKNWYSGKNKLIALLDSTLFSEENGNKEFGGYGAGCGFLYSNGAYFSHPILLTREICCIMENFDSYL